MNLILLDDTDFADKDLVCLAGRRFDHVRDILAKSEGETLRVGRINGMMGTGEIVRKGADELTLRVHLDQPPPPPLPLILVLALPRPKMLRRILQTISTMGVKHLYLINSYRVDKSYWNSPVLTQESLNEQLRLGLEQARDTLLPQVQLRPRFKPFVEDELPAISRDRTFYVAHPGAALNCPSTGTVPTLLAVGPEGGFVPYEITKMQDCGAHPVSLGSRILRVETVLPVLLARLAC